MLTQRDFIYKFRLENDSISFIRMHEAAGKTILKHVLYADMLYLLFEDHTYTIAQLVYEEVQGMLIYRIEYPTNEPDSVYHYELILHAFYPQLVPKFESEWELVLKENRKEADELQKVEDERNKERRERQEYGMYLKLAKKFKSKGDII